MNQLLRKPLLALLACGVFAPFGTSFAAVSIDEHGWTVVTPSFDSRIVYVSSSEGDDANDGLSPQTPKATIAAGNLIIRDHHPDHLLLKRGDTFQPGPGAMGRWKNGRSADEPLLFSYYGDSGPRPVVELSGMLINHDGDTKNYISIIGIDFYRPISNPADPRFNNSDSQSTFRFIGGGANVTVEDCRFRFTGVVAESYGGRYTDFIFRRNIVTDVWSHNSFPDPSLSQSEREAIRTHTNGIYIAGVFGYVVEENFFDHNGWNDQVQWAGPNMFAHNVYIQYSNGAGGVMRGNISARGSAHGMQARSGGIVERNVFVNNAIGVNLGGVAAPTDPAVMAFPNRIDQNVVLDGRLMDPTNNIWPRTNAVWAIDSNNLIPGALVEDNIVANRSQSGQNQSYLTSGNPVMVNNISYKWANDTPVDPTWPHPDAGLGDYNAAVGGQNDILAYYAVQRERGLREFPWDLTAYAAVSYIREGFNKSAVGGYYTYEGQPAIAVTGLAATQSSVALKAGEVTTLYSRVSPSGASARTIWASADPAIASITPEGRVTGRNPGTTQVTASTPDGAFTSTVAVTVSGPVVPVTSIVAPAGAAGVEVGRKIKLGAHVLPRNAGNLGVQWTISNPALASIDSDGVVTGLAVGSTSAVATSVDGGHTATMRLAVLPLSKWGGYDVTNGWASTGANYLGWVHVGQAPWLWSLAMDSWIYVEEDYLQPGGVWVFFPAFGSVSYPEAAPWVVIDALSAWAFIPGYTAETTEGWAFVLDSGQ